MAVSRLLANTAFLFDPQGSEFFAAVAPPTVSLAVDSGASAVDRLTNDFTLAVTAVSGATVEYSFDGINWSSTLPSSLADGTYTIKVRQTLGPDTSITTDFTFTYDATAPNPLTVALAHDTGADATDHITSDSSLTITGQENGALVEFSIDGGTTWTTEAPAGLAAGAYTVLVRQTDVAGNISGTSSLDFTIALVPGAPTLALAQDTGLSPTDHITSNPTIDVGDLITGGTVTYFIDGATVGVSSLPATWLDGQHTVVARQTDTVGDSADTTLTFTLDTVAPDVLEIAFVPDPAKVLGTAGYSFDVTGEETGALVEYSLDGGNTWTSTPPTGLDAGSYTVTVRQTDLAGNISDVASLDFNVTDTPVTPVTPTYVTPFERTYSDVGGLY